MSTDLSSLYSLNSQAPERPGRAGQQDATIALRPYQAEALSAAEAYLSGSGRAGLLVLPTGAGKSILLASLAQRAFHRGGRASILAHGAELISQNVVACVRLVGDDAVGVYAAGVGRREADRPITVASIRSTERLAERLGRHDLVLVDEAHLIKPDVGSGMYRRQLCNLTRLWGPVPLLGLTATPLRLTSGRLDRPWREYPPLFDRVVHEVGIRDLIRDRWLTGPVARATLMRLETGGVATRKGEFAAGPLQAVVDVEVINIAIAGEIVEAGRDRRSWLVFAAGVAHAENLARHFRAAGIQAAAVEEATPVREREAAIAKSRSGELRCLVGCELSTTGFDVPAMDLIALCRPRLSPGLHVQMVGRGMRLSPETGKTNCLVLDFAGNCLRHGPLDLIDGGDLGTGKGGGAAPTKICPNCATIVAVAARSCSECGHAFPLPAPPESKLKAASIVAPLLSDNPRAQGDQGGWLEVEGIAVSRWVKPAKPASLKIDYHVVARQWPVSDWLAFDSSAKSARRIAEAKWVRLTGRPAPSSTNEAFSMRAAIRCPARIPRSKVLGRRRGKPGRLWEGRCMTARAIALWGCLPQASSRPNPSRSASFLPSWAPP